LFMEPNQIRDAHFLDILFEDNRAPGEGCERGLNSVETEALTKSMALMSCERRITGVSSRRWLSRAE
jgi:hypothetical protein